MLTYNPSLSGANSNTQIHIPLYATKLPNPAGVGVMWEPRGRDWEGRAYVTEVDDSI